MFSKIFRILLTFVGLVTGFTFAKTIVLHNLSVQNIYIELAIIIVSCIVFAFLTYLLYGKLMFNAYKNIIRSFKRIKKIKMYHIIVILIGIFIGLVLANLITIPLKKIEIIGGPISLCVNIFLGGFFGYLFYVKKEEVHIKAFKMMSGTGPSKVIDTCVIIDGRILDIVKTGFFKGPFVIPTFITKELQTLADSPNGTKRAKGKLGLDNLEAFKGISKEVVLKDTSFDDLKLETDVKLLKYAQKNKCTIVTLDYNLNKVAVVTGIDVLNMNDLCNSLKITSVPGEKMFVNVQKKGKENGQGIGYLDDGTMVIIENGFEHIGEEAEVIVTSVTQTSAGRLIFTKASA